MFQDLIDECLGLEIKKVEDYWKDRAEIPLFARKRVDTYTRGRVPDDEVISLEVDTRSAQRRNVFNCLICATTGVGKTRLTKNMIKGFHKQNYRILFFEPKSYEMLNARKTGEGRRIHFKDKNERLPVVSYSPQFIYADIERDYPHLIGQTNFYSPDMKLLNYREIWQSFGCSDKSADVVVQLINKGERNIANLIKGIKKANLHFATEKAAISALNNLVGTGFFGTNKKLKLKKEWDKGNIVVVNYLSRDGVFMNTDVGLILDQVRDIGKAEYMRSPHSVTKKLIVFDDSFYYAGTEATKLNKDGINLAVRNISNCQNNFRTWGVDTVFIVQSPDPNAIASKLIDGCTTKIISYTENPTALRNKMPQEAYNLLSNTREDRPKLYVDERSYTYQWLIVKGKTQWMTGFPFDCTVGH